MQDALDPTHLFKEIKQSVDDSIFHMFHSEQWHVSKLHLLHLGEIR